MTGKAGALQSKESPRKQRVPWKRLKELSTINILIEGMRKLLDGFLQLQSAKRCCYLTDPSQKEHFAIRLLTLVNAITNMN